MFTIIAVMIGLAVPAAMVWALRNEAILPISFLLFGMVFGNWI